MKKNKLFIIARLILLFIFIGISIFLIIESVTPSESSAKQSNDMGNAIVNIVNDMGGDKAEIIEPESVLIKNKIDIVTTKSKMTLELETFPITTRYKSYKFLSSDEEKAIIDEFGNVSFISSGIVTITAINTYNEEIKDSFTLEVKDILAKDLEVSIKGIDAVDGIYNLTLGKSYQIDTKIIPDDTTNKDLTYYVLDNEYIEVSSGQINVLKESMDSIIDIHVRLDDIDKIIKVKTSVKEKEYIPLESFNISNILGYEDSIISITPKLSFTPLNASNKAIVIVEIIDNEIAEIKGKTQIHLLKEGSTKVRIKSLDLNTIIEGDITVSKRPALVDYNAYILGDLIVNETKRILFDDINPLDSIIENPIFDAITIDTISVTSDGKVKGLAKGLGKIKVNVSGIEKILEINVLDLEEETIDFTIQALHGDMPFIEVGKNINLNDYFKVEEFIPTAIKKDMEYEIELGSAKVNGNILKAFDEGLIKIRMIHKSSGISKDIFMRAYYPIKINEDFNSDSFILNKEYILHVNSNSMYEPKIDSINSNIDLIINSSEVRIFSEKIGESVIVIYPKYENEIVEEGKVLLKYFVVHKDTSIFNIHFDIKKSNEKEQSFDNPLELNLYKNDLINYSTALDLDITRSKISIVSENIDVIDIENDSLIIKDTGDAKVRFFEEYSGLERIIVFHVSNLLSLNQKNKIKIIGNYTYKDDTITIVNGESIQLMYNFTKHSTIKTTRYLSSNLDVAIIGDDGVITPIKAGDTLITMEVIDKDNVLATYQVKLVVHQKDVIENISDFIYIYVRKGLGHFGIFFLLAIFAALSIFMYFKNDKWWIVLIKIAVLFIYGFSFAGFTEFLQTLTPGRFGIMSDVLVDFLGYSIASIILSIGFILYLFIKKKKKSIE